MKTFAVTVQIDARIVVTDEFIAALRAASQDRPGDLVNPKADVFLAMMDAQHEDDEEFVKAVLANGMRKMTRLSLVDNLHHSGVAATVSPASVDFIAIPAIADKFTGKTADLIIVDDLQDQADKLAELAAPELSTHDIEALVATADPITPPASV